MKRAKTMLKMAQMTFFLGGMKENVYFCHKFMIYLWYSDI